MNKLLNEIKRFKKLTNLNESEPIRGIRDFVFNPLTGFGGKIGYGYVKGKKITGAHWPDHDTHLHITFDDKQVAMEVIDKGNSMGLTVGENPYAKNDPTGRMEYVHAKNKKTGELTSYHYKNFDNIPHDRTGSYDYGGQLVVGRAVDISGPMNKMLEFCKWVLSTYETKGYSPVPSLDLTSKKTEDNNLPTTLKPQSVGSKNEPEKNILSKSTETKPTSIGGSSDLATSSGGDENALLEKIKKSEYLGMKVEEWLRIKNNPQELFFYLMRMMDI